ncbi:hypothetical protein BJ875DRAFT_461446 [Amylocarpus encephaloides]|uniref:NAD(P)-binding domain-containing protein n=1 Tax=Amylocarpus encephaloides TaxID=45428 RepID=A0A9P7YIH7_9HELO|nr:hypothetical protein BJ875DRAFT_461446 [Amylocarpus encephaloides]
MRILLLGATGSLGSRCVQALLAHNHTLTVYVRNPAKLRSMFTPSLLARLDAVVIGDATDAQAIAKALREHDIEGIVDVAGNQVLPWKEYALPKIARAATEAAITVGGERGRPLRAWITSGMGVLRIPGEKWMIQDYMFRAAGAQHDATRQVVEAIPTSQLQWSLLCVGRMQDADPKCKVHGLLDSPHPHNLLTEATFAPRWETTWVSKIPLVGIYVDIWIVIVTKYKAKYEEVADFLAGDLVGEKKWVGMKVGYKQENPKDA